MASQAPTVKTVELMLPWPPTLNTYWRSLVLPRRNKRTGKTKPSPAVLLSEDGRNYRTAVAQAVMLRRVGGQLHGKLAVDIIAYPPDLRARDLDNLPKGVLDGLKRAGVFRDDSDIDDLRIRRGPVRKGGELAITIREIPGLHTTSGFLFDRVPPAR